LSFIVGIYAFVLGLGIYAIVSQLSYVKGGLLIGLFVLSILTIGPILVVEGFRALKVKSLRLDSSTLNWEEADGRSHMLKLETVRRIRRSASKWTVESSDGLSVVLPITPVLDMALSHARYAFMPNVAEAENQARRRGRIRCLLYLGLSPLVAGGLLMALAPGLPILPTLAPLVSFVAQIAFLLLVVAAIVMWRRYRFAHERRRDHAANRQLSTTPLPSPTTPENHRT
jgi:membrane protein implicated in regulation of membrane protease activity